MLHVLARILRQRPGTPAHYDQYSVEVPDDANVIDIIDAAWRQDPTLMYRHACHHASCGTCGVRINGYEKLPCIVPVRDALDGHQVIVIEPLRNFPIVGDLVVDVSGFFQKQIASGMVITRQAEGTLEGQAFEHTATVDMDGQWVDRPTNRFENCVECGICISACPTMAASDGFFGPAGLAAIQRAVQTTADPAKRAELLALADGEHGVWQCHSVYECTEACPQDVDPAGAIMALRRELIASKVKKLFGG